MARKDRKQEIHVHLDKLKSEKDIIVIDNTLHAWDGKRYNKDPRIVEHIIGIKPEHKNGMMWVYRPGCYFGEEKSESLPCSINLQNGIFVQNFEDDITPGLLMPHSKRYGYTRVATASFVEPSQEQQEVVFKSLGLLRSPRLLQHLRELTYSPKEMVTLWVGAKESGVHELYQLWADILGDYAVVASASHLSHEGRTSNGGRHTEYMASQRLIFSPPHLNPNVVTHDGVRTMTMDHLFNRHEWVRSDSNLVLVCDRIPYSECVDPTGWPSRHNNIVCFEAQLTEDELDFLSVLRYDRKFKDAFVSMVLTSHGHGPQSSVDTWMKLNPVRPAKVAKPPPLREFVTLEFIASKAIVQVSYANDAAKLPPWDCIPFVFKHNGAPILVIARADDEDCDKCPEFFAFKDVQNEVPMGFKFACAVLPSKVIVVSGILVSDWRFEDTQAPIKEEIMARLSERANAFR